jgi:hypothetical protein
MKTPGIVFPIVIYVIVIIFTACSVLEKSSQHGFENGFYKFRSKNLPAGKVYVHMDDKEVEVYKNERNSLENLPLLINLADTDLITGPIEFTRKSLDIDLTTILLKYRPPVNDMPAQMITDFNIALYAGWRHDTYIIKKELDPLKKPKTSIMARGYDFGVFAGPGTTVINSFSTANKTENEYNGMILQYGLAGFLESNVASFGVAVGFDYLVSPDRKIWIYTRKPWFGLIIGIALN